jgi:hypothetical protein
MPKRASGPPRRPRNPIARAVHTPLFKQRVEADKRKKLPPLTERKVHEAVMETEPEDKSET